MKKTDRISLTRLAYCIIIAITLIGFPVGISYISSLLFDQIICFSAVNICFLLVFVLYIIRKRLNNNLPEKNYNSYGKITFALILCYTIILLCVLYAPQYFAPLMLIPLIFYPVLDIGSNFVMSFYLVLSLAIFQNFSNYELISSLLLIVFGICISEFSNGTDILEKILANVLAFSISILVPNIFYYFAFLEINLQTFIYSIKCGLITLLVSSVVVPLFNRSVKNMQNDVYDMLLEQSYGLREDIRKFSYLEYQHSLRVSRLSKICAHEIGANEMLAACGGFYYRIGKMEGEPMIDNAIKLANDHCFPEELINLLSEYGGIISLPSTKESAIVHMVDSIVTKVELFDSDSMSSSWNQNMVIYQTINELSQKGMYDESGLTMNQFLTIREKLANEDILA